MTKSIAIIGASRDSDKLSYKAVLAYKQLGYTVYPVNPNADDIAGVKAYARLADIPNDFAEASVYVPPNITLQLLEDLKKKNLEKLYLNPGSADEEVRVLAKELGLPAVEACSIRAVGINPASVHE